MVCPASFKRYSRAPKRTIASLSRLADGSSMTMTLGSMVQTEAMAISCFSPAGKREDSPVQQALKVHLATHSLHPLLHHRLLHGNILHAKNDLICGICGKKLAAGGPGNTLPTIVPSW